METTEYNKSVTKVNGTDTTGFVLKTIYDTDKSDLEKKLSDAIKEIPDISSLVKESQILILKLLR